MIAWRLLAVMVLCGAGAGGKFCPADSPPPRDISSAIPPCADPVLPGGKVPSYNDQGVMTSQIFGDSARVLPNGDVEIESLRMEFYSHQGDDRIVDMTVTSPQCFYNRARGIVISDSDVRISRQELVVTGKGFSWNNEKQELKIMSESKVVLRGARKSIKVEDDKRE